MALQWFESDGTTPLSSLDMGSVGAGQSYNGIHSAYKQVVLKNTGSSGMTSVTVDIRQVSQFPLNAYLKIATGTSTPGSFVGSDDDPLDIADLAASGTAKVWVDMVVPLGASAEVGQFANLRASGSEA